MPIELPSNVAPMYTETIQVNVYRDALFVDIPNFSGTPPIMSIDKVASSLVYAETLRAAIRNVRKRALVGVTVHPTNGPGISVSINDNHPQAREVIEDVGRLAHEIHASWRLWITEKDSDRAREIFRRYAGKGITPVPPPKPEEEF